MNPPTRGWRHPAIAALVVTGLLVVVAIGSNGRSWGSAGSSQQRHLSPEFWNYVGSAFIALWLAAIVWLVYTIIRMGHERDPTKRRKKDWTRTIALLITLLLVLIIRLRDPNLLSRFGHRHGTTHGAAAGGHGGQKPQALAQPAKTDFHWEATVGVLLVIALAVGLFLLYKRLTTPRHLPTRNEIVAAALVQMLDDTLDDLRNEPDPRRAVIAAYARMERTFAAYGLPRVPSEAPVEYLRRMLAELDVSGASARRLTDLYERAKFSTHEVDARMKDDAISALVALRDELQREPEAA